jgi:hypothetical protein
LKEMKEIFIKAANCNSRNVVVCSMAHCWNNVDHLHVVCALLKIEILFMRGL